MYCSIDIDVTKLRSARNDAVTKAALIKTSIIAQYQYVYVTMPLLGTTTTTTTVLLLLLSSSSGVFQIKGSISQNDWSLILLIVIATLVIQKKKTRILEKKKVGQRK